MAESILTPHTESSGGPHIEPELLHTTNEPKGVLQKNLKTFVYLGAALLVIVAAIMSSTGKKTPAQQAAAKGQPPQPTLQDNTDNNVQDLKNQLQAQRQKEQQQAALAAATGGDPALASATPAQRAAASAYGPTGSAMPCMPGEGVPGQPCPQAQSGYGQQNTGQQQLTPVQEQAQQIASKERARADDSRFASNLAYSRPPEQPQGPGQMMPVSQRQADSSLVAARAAGEQQNVPEGYKRPMEANVDSATGQPYLVYEGSVLDTILMNRLDGDAAGAVKVLVSNPLYSHDHQHVIIPEGTVVLGEAKKIGAAGIGQQRRIAVVFHRLIMPDGYSVDLDQFHGLDQIGEEGLKDLVNNHYFEIFGASIALGVISGAGEIEQGGGAITTNGSQAFTNGTAASVSQSANTILDRFMQIPPTITIREGHRVKVYFTQDLLLPAYTNHTIPQTF
ncbi:MAG TPA: TrbI/VirB10 family protein [Edaphobacter sp.]|uniref:TrbI/VirB10 family protein n=1 Tax=Edaphobacter sp. TaxID=1934404 RepID=UPI002BBF857F|nr:TrbI/VirB10 family protein [Edaphobacter sp.]HUZ95987.1 TrbI/VirB10 family protein [Edaphobacter sp.]